jgi:hypothetical protein
MWRKDPPRHETLLKTRLVTEFKTLISTVPNETLYQAFRCDIGTIFYTGNTVTTKLFRWLL